MLPELALDEFFPLYKDTRYFAYAEELDGPTVRRFRSLAGELGIYLALPLFEKSLIGTYYNSLVLLTPEGTIGAVYRKVHVPCTRSYERYYSHPDRSLWWRIRYGKVGLAICYDRRYPETCRELMKKGARLILISISSSIMPGGFSELPSSRRNSRPGPLKPALSRGLQPLRAGGRIHVLRPQHALGAGRLRTGPGR